MFADPKRRDERAAQIVQHAWRDLPANDQRLLETIGASQWTITVEPVGHAVDGLLRSAGYAPLDQRGRRGLDDAAGVWIAELRLVVINAAHPALTNLDERTYEAILALIAWHEWAHALSVVRATHDDVSAGERLLALAPAGIAEFVRRGGYRVSTKPMSSSPRSSLCSYRIAGAAKLGSLPGLTTRSTSSSGG